MMKKRISIAFGLALCIVLAAGIISVQAENQEIPEKYITVGSTTDGKLPDGSTEYYIEVENYGDEITLPENTFEKEETAFKGWIYNYNFYQPGEKVRAIEGEQLIAVLTGNNSYGLLTLNPEFKGYGYMQIDDSEGASLVIPSIYEDFYEYNQYDVWFEGWFKNADGSGDEYLAGDIPNIDKGDLIVLYAVWNSDLTQAYKIDFNLNNKAFDDFDSGYCYVKKGETFFFMQGVGIEDYELEGWYDKPEGGNLICKKGEEYTEFTPTSDITLYAHWLEEPSEDSSNDDPSDYKEISFVDVAEGDYFYKPVKWAATLDIISGTDETHFSPENKTTRAQMVTFLWRVAGEPVVNYALSFTDVKKDNYYEEAVRWAASEKITTGTDEDTFSPDEYVTREQLAAFIYRYVQTQGQGFQGSWYFLLNFKDAGNINDWADEAMHWCVQNGIINGVSDDMIQPQGTATRGQIVTMLYRYFSI